MTTQDGGGVNFQPSKRGQFSGAVDICGICQLAELSQRLDEHWKTKVWTSPLVRIGAACVGECDRDNVGLRELACLVGAYHYASENADRLPTEEDLLQLAEIVEPNTRGQYRDAPTTTAFAEGATLASAVSKLLGSLERGIDVDDFCQQLLSIRPFGAGTRRLAFVLKNWLKSTLMEPEPLPEYEL